MLKNQSPHFLKNSIDDWLSDDEGISRRRRMGARAIIIALLSALLLFGISGLYVYHLVGEPLLSGLCGNQVIEEDAQPGGKLEFVAMKRDCGATTGYSYHLSIVKRGKAISDAESGNVYVAAQPFVATWSDRHTIRISGSGSKVFKQKRAYQGIRIVYDG